MGSVNIGPEFWRTLGDLHGVPGRLVGDANESTGVVVKQGACQALASSVSVLSQLPGVLARRMMSRAADCSVVGGMTNSVTR